MVMSIDPLKTNLTADEASQLLAQLTAGKTFSDGTYEYRVVVKNTEIINGLIIMVGNNPDHIGPDLITYVLSRLEVLIRNYKERNEMEFYVIKIWMDSWGHRINFQDEMLKGNNDDPEFTFKTKDTAEKYYKTIDFTEGNRRREINMKKLHKYIDHFNNSYNNLHASATDVLHPNDKTYKMMKQIIGHNPVVKIDAQAYIGFDSTVEDGDVKTTYTVKIRGWMDKATNEWIQKLYAYTLGEDLANTHPNDSRNELKYAFRRAISDICKKACDPTKNYFLHSLVHIDDIFIEIRPQEGYDTFENAYNYSF